MDRTIKHQLSSPFNLAFGCLVALFITAAGCGVLPHDLSGDNRVSAADDQGRLRLSTGYPWMDRVAVSSSEPWLRKAGAKLVRDSFSVKLVPVPSSWVLVRISPCKTNSSNLCVSVQYNGTIISSAAYADRSRSGRNKCPDTIFEDNRSEIADFLEGSFDKIGRG